MKKILTFYLNNSLFGIDIILVKEINRNIEYTSVPGANDYISGLYNMRGQIVTLFNLSKIIRFKESNKKRQDISIILKSQHNSPNQIGFIIDELGDVIDLNMNDCEFPPPNIGPDKENYISNIVKLKEQLLMIIDYGKILERILDV